MRAQRGGSSYINDGEIFVRLDPAESQQKNVVLLANALVKQTSLIGIRHILNEPLELSIDLNLVKNLLKEMGDRRILDWFFRNEYQATIDKSDEIREWNGKIFEIDEMGLFTRLLLVELDDYSKKVAGKPSSPEMFNEIAGFVDFLFKIATREYKQEVPLEYTSKNIKTGIIPVGMTSKMILLGIEPYLIAFAYRLREQLTSIYVVIWDKEFLDNVDAEAYNKFVEATESLDKDIQRTFQISKDFELKYTCTDYKGNKRKAKIIRYIPEYSSQ